MVEEELVEKGIKLMSYGGEIPVIPISAKSGENLDLLQELIIEEANLIKLKGDHLNDVEL